jgi:hypothetical protein
MADLKLQASRALAVVPSDTIDIPQPSSKVATGATTSLGSDPNDLIDTAATFTDGNVKVGDIVHDITNGVIDTVAAIVDDNNLTLTNGVIANGATYNIYRYATKDTVIYVGVTGDVVVETSGGDSVTLKAVPAGMIIPLNVKRVDSTLTTATDLVAMW